MKQRCPYCNATFIKKMAVCPCCGASLLDSEPQETQKEKNDINITVNSSPSHEIIVHNRAVCKKCGNILTTKNILHKCKTCGESFCSHCPERIRKCTRCKDWYCNDHYVKCRQCGGILCEKCAKPCHVCGRILCMDDIDLCSRCGELFCRDHIEGHKCQEPTKIETGLFIISIIVLYLFFKLTGVI